MTTTTNQTQKEFKAGTFADTNNFRTIAILGFVLVLAAAVAFTAVNGRVGTVSLAANVAAPADSIITLDMLHALESGYNPDAVSAEASADGALTLGMIHAYESGFRPAVQSDSILTLDMIHAYESGYVPGE